MKHPHNWCDHPPDSKLSYDKTWEERYYDTEAIAENKEANSSEYFEDLLYTLEVDPHMKDHPDFWPEVTEWCSEFKKTRHVKLVMDMKVKKLVKTRKVVVGVTEKIMEISRVTDQGEKVAEDVMTDKDKVEHKVICEVIVCS